jgi:TIR domain-containing protein
VEEAGVADVFLSYSSADRPRASTIAGLLARAGWSVWWDRSIEGGEEWGPRIENELAGARCVLVLWSRESIHSDWVLREATAARARGVLLPVLLAPVAPPETMSDVQAIALMTWPGDERWYELQPLVARIAGLLGGVPPAVDEPAFQAAASHLSRVDAAEAAFAFCAARLAFHEQRQRSGVTPDTLDRMEASYRELCESLAPISDLEVHHLVSRHERAFTPSTSMPATD